MRDRMLPFALAASILVLDQITKGLIKAHVPAWQTLIVIPGFFNIVHAENPGMAFSLLADASGLWRNVLLIGLSFSVAGFITVLLVRGGPTQHWLVRLGLSLVLGGALGNLYDRAVHGTVTDFVEVYAGSHFFPAFNVADSAISVGAVLLILDMWRAREKSGQVVNVP
ncbi:MAG TPA: signal peptidase II [Bryobacteraceae bacterium]|nr:signal peptidase II [Bryobacteraceae bacterium]